MADERTIVEWRSYDDAKDLPEAPVETFGGIARELTRAEYLDGYAPEQRAYIEAIWRALDAGPLFGGRVHQDARTPVFDDGTHAGFSMRAWGDLVAAWWNDRHPTQPTTYASFAWEHEVSEADLLARLTPEVIARSRAIHAIAATRDGGLSSLLAWFMRPPKRKRGRNAKKRARERLVSR